MAMVQLYMYAILMRNRTLASDFSFMSFSFSSDLFIHEMRLSNKFKQKKISCTYFMENQMGNANVV